MVTCRRDVWWPQSCLPHKRTRTRLPTKQKRATEHNGNKTRHRYQTALHQDTKTTALAKQRLNLQSRDQLHASSNATRANCNRAHIYAQRNKFLVLCSKRFRYTSSRGGVQHTRWLRLNSQRTWEGPQNFVFKQSFIGEKLRLHRARRIDMHLESPGSGSIVLSRRSVFADRFLTDSTSTRNRAQQRDGGFAVQHWAGAHLLGMCVVFATYATVSLVAFLTRNSRRGRATRTGSQNAERI